MENQENQELYEQQLTNVSILDVECLPDYFSVQIKNCRTEEYILLEAFDNQGILRIYNIFKSSMTIRKSFYTFTEYDHFQINNLFKMVEKQDSNEVNYCRELRAMNDCYIGKMPGWSYNVINREFWCNTYFKLLPSFSNNEMYSSEYEASQACFEESKNVMLIKYKANYGICNYIRNHSYALGKSKIFKGFDWIDVPRLLFWYSTRVDNSIQCTVSLKKAQLYNEQTCLKLDFNKYKSIQVIKDNNLYDTWKEYMQNDVEYLFRLYKNEILPNVENRLEACKAIKTVDDTFNWGYECLHSPNNNTTLLRNAFELDHEQPEDLFNDFSYRDFIKPTGYEKFDKFISFVDDNKHIKSDRKLKELYCQWCGQAYIQDDSKEVSVDGLKNTIIKSFNTMMIHGVELIFGFGGGHACIPNYKGKNLKLADFKSLYPSIIIHFEKFFGQILNIKRYKGLFDLKNKTLDKQLKDQGKTPEEIKSIKKVIKGVKLMLNSLFGVVNSEFNFKFSNKIIGRFICLFGQYLLITLADTIKDVAPEAIIVNMNTDGIYIDNITDEQLEEVIRRTNYSTFKLECEDVDFLLQLDVNNYVKIQDGILSHKGGSFSESGVKHAFTSDDKLMVNMKNALKYIQNKTPEIEPILFSPRIRLEGEDTSFGKIYYLTSKDNGKYAVKYIQKPIILSLDEEIYYFTTEKTDADIKEYMKFARLTQEKIMNFEINIKKHEYIYIPSPLNMDTPENIQEKKDIRKQLYTCINKSDICLGNSVNGYTKEPMCIAGKVSKDYSHFNMTKIQQSRECTHFYLQNNDNYVTVFTNDKYTMDKLDTIGTLKISYGYGCFYIFSSFISQSDLKIQLVNNPYIPLWDNTNTFSCNFESIKASNL